MHVATISRYAAMADARERDPIVTPGEHGRADVASGRMSKWMRFNRADQLVYRENFEGVSYALTRSQARVLEVVQRIERTGVRVTLRAIADLLTVAPSTIYRALVKLASLGFIAYQSNRGRHGGTVFLMRQSRDGLEWAREAAKVTVRRWWKASEARISRLRGNVASWFPGREEELYQYPVPVAVTGRNKYAAWSVDDFREAGLM